MVLLFGLPHLCRADSDAGWTVRYSSPANAVTIVGPDGVTWHQNYSGQQPNAHGGGGVSSTQPTAGGGGTGGGGGTRPGGGTSPGGGGGSAGSVGPGSVDCQGAITATIEWDTTKGPRPSCVIIKETATASWSGSTGSGSDGLGGVAANTGGGELAGGGSCTTVRYSAKSDLTGNPDPMMNSPVANAALPAPTGGLQGASANVSYKVEVFTVDIALSGGIVTNDTHRYLIGQQVGATLNTGELQQTTWNWNVGGGEAFKNWTANQNTATYTQLGSETSSSLVCHFKVPGEGSITCSAHLAVPAGAIPAAGFDVSVSKKCTVKEPDFIELLVYTHQNANQYPGPGTILLPGYPTNGVGLYGGPPPTTMAFRGLSNPYGGTSLGIIWHGKVTTSNDLPNPWGGYGGWNFVQEVQGNRYRVRDGESQENGENSPDEKLDGEYPYPAEYPNNFVPATFPADGRLGRSGDQTSEPLDNLITELEVGENFGTWMMYQPPGTGSVFVPLKKIKWQWYGKARKPLNRDWTVSDLVGSNSSWQFDGLNFPRFPEWDSVSGSLLDFWRPVSP